MKEVLSRKSWSSILFSLLTFLVGSGGGIVITGMAFEAGYYETLHIPSPIIVNYDRWRHVFFGWFILLEQNLWLVVGWMIAVMLLGLIVFMYLWIALWNFMGSVALKLSERRRSPEEEPFEAEPQGNSTKGHGGAREEPSKVEPRENSAEEHDNAKLKIVIGKVLLFLISSVVFFGVFAYLWVWAPLQAYQRGQNLANRQLQEPEAHFDKVRLLCGQSQVERDISSREYYLLLATSKYSVLAPLDDLHNLIVVDPASLGCFMEIIINSYTPPPASTPIPSPRSFLLIPVGGGD